MTNDTIPDAAEAAKVPSIAIMAAGVVLAETVVPVESDVTRPSLHTIPDDAPVVSVSAIEVAPAPAPIVVGGNVIPPPPDFVMAQAATALAAPIPTVTPATSVVEGMAVRPFELSISDEGSLPPLTVAAHGDGLDEFDFPMSDVGGIPRSRSMLDSIWLPEDPILTQKMEPEVAARRERLRQFVKGTLLSCGGMCVVALVCSLFGHLTESSANAAEAARPVAIAHSARTNVETFEEVDYGHSARGLTKALRARSQAHR